MQKWILFIAFLSAIISLPAQNYSVKVNGLITDHQQAAIPGYPVYAFVDSTGNFVYSAQTHTDENGQFVFEADIPESISAGELNVFTYNCDGSLLQKVLEFSEQAGTFEVAWTICDSAASNCGVEILMNETGILQAFVSGGVPPYSYEWDGNPGGPVFEAPGYGTYCVTVTDATGCAATACYRYTVDDGLDSIECLAYLRYFRLDSTDYLGLNFFSDSSNWNFQWASGDTSQLIALRDSGVYCITATNAVSNCVFSDCFYWNGGTTPEDSSGCRFQFLIDSSGTGPWWHIEGSGQAPYSYTWDHGQLPEKYEDLAPGTYCLTVTDAAGCSDVACFTVRDSMDYFTCWTSLGVNLEGTTVRLTARPVGLSPFTYQWSTGAVTASISVQNSGYFCVTVTDASGCQSSPCIDHVDPSEAGRLIGGYVLDSDSLGISGHESMVILLKKANDQFVPVDTVILPNISGAFNFGVREVGDYLILAIPPVESPYLPTYFGNVVHWQEASVVQLPMMLPRLLDISWIKKTSPNPGPGNISGTVSAGDGFTGNAIDNRGAELPAGQMVVLLNAAGQPIAFTLTDQDGKFSFDNLALGMYTLHLEMPGIPPARMMVLLDAEQSSVSNLGFEVNGNAITTDVDALETKFTQANLKASPNPVHEDLQLILENAGPERVYLRLMQLNGQVISTHEMDPFELRNRTSMDVNQLSPGLYILHWQQGRQSGAVKVVKQ